MSPLLGPILAQLVTLSVSDRTEARYVISDQQYQQQNANGAKPAAAAAATTPRVLLNTTWRHASLVMGYGASITVAPLEREDRDVLLFHFATLGGSYRWSRTTITFAETLGYGEVNYQVQALADPRTAPTLNPNTATPSGGTTPTPPASGSTTGTTGGTGTPQAQLGTNPNLPPVTGAVKLGTSVSSVNFTHLLSAVSSLAGGVFYTVSGAVGDDPYHSYPTIRGPGAFLTAGYRPNRNDNFSTTANTQFATSVASKSTAPNANGAPVVTTNLGGNRAWLLTANENWTHRFSKETSTRLGAGLSLIRNSQPDGLISYTISPNFVLGVTYTSLVGRKSTLTLGSNVTVAPYIDPVQARADPNLGANVFASFNQNRFSSTLTAGTQIALVPRDSTSTLNSMTSALTLAYALGVGLSLDGGMRAAWQSFSGSATIPPSVAAFAGFTVGAQIPLSRGL